MIFGCGLCACGIEMKLGAVIPEALEALEPLDLWQLLRNIV